MGSMIGLLLGDDGFRRGGTASGGGLLADSAIRR